MGFNDCLEAARAAYPFLDNLPTVLGVAPEQLSGRIAYIESVAVTGAIRYLMARDVPALPVFDSLIVPVVTEGLPTGALQGSYRAYLGAAGETIERVTGTVPPWSANRERGVPIRLSVRRDREAAAAEPSMPLSA